MGSRRRQRLHSAIRIVATATVLLGGAAPMDTGAILGKRWSRRGWPVG